MRQTELSITVEDGETGQSFHANVTIDVVDVNDNAPQFTRESYEFSVAENTEQRFAIQTTDLDEEENGQLFYSIVDGENLAYPITIEPESFPPVPHGTTE